MRRFSGIFRFDMRRESYFPYVSKDNGIMLYRLHEWARIEKLRNFLYFHDLKKIVYKYDGGDKSSEIIYITSLEKKSDNLKHDQPQKLRLFPVRRIRKNNRNVAVREANPPISIPFCIKWDERRILFGVNTLKKTQVDVIHCYDLVKERIAFSIQYQYSIPRSRYSTDRMKQCIKLNRKLFLVSLNSKFLIYSFERRYLKYEIKLKFSLFIHGRIIPTKTNPRKVVVISGKTQSSRNVNQYFAVYSGRLVSFDISEKKKNRRSRYLVDFEVLPKKCCEFYALHTFRCKSVEYVIYKCSHFINIHRLDSPAILKRIIVSQRSEHSSCLFSGDEDSDKPYLVVGNRSGHLKIFDLHKILHSEEFFFNRFKVESQYGGSYTRQYEEYVKRKNVNDVNNVKEYLIDRQRVFRTKVLALCKFYEDDSNKQQGIFYIGYAWKGKLKCVWVDMNMNSFFQKIDNSERIRFVMDEMLLIHPAEESSLEASLKISLSSATSFYVTKFLLLQ